MSEIKLNLPHVVSIITTEACWRIFQFDLHHRDPPVERLSLDTICKATMKYNTMENMCPTEFLNKMTFPGIPNHELKLKVGLPVMLLKSLCHQATRSGPSCTCPGLGKKWPPA